MIEQELLREHSAKKPFPLTRIEGVMVNLRSIAQQISNGIFEHPNFNLSVLQAQADEEALQTPKSSSNRERYIIKAYGLAQIHQAIEERSLPRLEEHRQRIIGELATRVDQIEQQAVHGHLSTSASKIARTYINQLLGRTKPEVVVLSPAIGLPDKPTIASSELSQREELPTVVIDHADGTVTINDKYGSRVRRFRIAEGAATWKTFLALARIPEEGITKDQLQQIMERNGQSYYPGTFLSNIRNRIEHQSGSPKIITYDWNTDNIRFRAQVLEVNQTQASQQNSATGEVSTSVRDLREEPIAEPRWEQYLPPSPQTPPSEQSASPIDIITQESPETERSDLHQDTPQPIIVEKSQPPEVSIEPTPQEDKDGEPLDEFPGDINIRRI